MNNMSEREERIALLAILIYESFVAKGGLDYQEEEDGIHVDCEIELNDAAVESTLATLHATDFDNMEIMHYTAYEDEEDE